jgi:hypothetical protein
MKIYRILFKLGDEITHETFYSDSEYDQDWIEFAKLDTLRHFNSFASIEIQEFELISSQTIRPENPTWFGD